jgi:hypothetical protein
MQYLEDMCALSVGQRNLELLKMKKRILWGITNFAAFQHTTSSKQTALTFRHFPAAFAKDTKYLGYLCVSYSVGFGIKM